MEIGSGGIQGNPPAAQPAPAETKKTADDQETKRAVAEAAESDARELRRREEDERRSADRKRAQDEGRVDVSV